jgi:hypothetical protein
MFDVPYDEPTGRNPHHVVNDIREESFSAWEDAELFFQDLDGSDPLEKRPADERDRMRGERPRPATGRRPVSVPRFRLGLDEFQHCVALPP